MADDHTFECASYPLGSRFQIVPVINPNLHPLSLSQELAHYVESQPGCATLNKSGIHDEQL